MRANVRQVAGLTVSALVLAVPLAAQSTGPSHQGFDPTVRPEGHYHDGEIGAKLLAIELDLRCNCGCGLDLHHCQFQMQCDVSTPWAARIRRSLEAGETSEAIEASFVSEFGPSVLMAPPAEGFNLVGYLMPSFALVAAGIFVGLVARSGKTGLREAPVEELSPADEERLREALKAIDEAESPDW